MPASAGQVGPNLDDAFRQDRADGEKSTSIQGLVDYWIQYPNVQGVMPAGLFKGQDAQDVAAYVGARGRRARPGHGCAGQRRASGQPEAGGREGRRARDRRRSDRAAEVPRLQRDGHPGQVTMKMKNMSADPARHRDQGQRRQPGRPDRRNGGVSTVSVSLTAGTYTFYCSVDGHAAAGMIGTITVK